MVILSIGLVDFGIAIYQRYAGDYQDGIGYSAHIGGGAAGILIGMNVLRNFNHKVRNQCTVLPRLVRRRTI